MQSSLVSVITYTTLPVAAMIVGSVIAAFRPPGPRLRSYIQHFAAGVVFSAVAVELLPDVRRQYALFALLLGFSLGVGVMLSIKWLSAQYGQAEQSEGEQPTSLLVTVGVDVFIDGLLIGLSFVLGAQEGKLLTLALSTEVLSLGLAVSAALGKAGVTRGKSIALMVVVALLLMLGAILGETVLQGLASPAMEIVLAFGLAALLYLVTEELLVEAHEEPESPLAAATFFVGFLLILVLGGAS